MCAFISLALNRCEVQLTRALCFKGTGENLSLTLCRDREKVSKEIHQDQAIVRLRFSLQAEPLKHESTVLFFTR